MKEKDKLPELTKDEAELLSLLSQGLGKKGIAKQLRVGGVEVRTAERLMDKITAKFSLIDDRLVRIKGQADEDEIGYLGRIAIILKIYRDYYMNQDAQPIFYVRRRDIHFEMDMTKDQVTIETEVSIQSLSKMPLAYVAHGLILDD